VAFRVINGKPFQGKQALVRERLQTYPLMDDRKMHRILQLLFASFRS
jgi:hypothetical protein